MSASACDLSDPFKVVPACSMLPSVIPGVMGDCKGSH